MSHGRLTWEITLVAKPDAMDQLFERADRIVCQKCAASVDISQAPFFSAVQCPNCGARFSVPAKFGQFILIQRLSGPGPAPSFRARDRALGRQVVVKLMTEASSDEATIARFHKGARTVAALNHPNVVKVYSVDEHHGAPYIVMEMVAGGGLDSLMSRGAPLDEARVLRMAIDVAEGLRAAQDAGLVHGDIRPSNVLLDTEGAAKVANFHLEPTGDGNRGAGRLASHPLYVAPERVAGQRADHRADVYSLGAMMYHAVTARPPFGGHDAAAVLQARLQGPPPDIRQVNPRYHSETADVIVRMMAVDPNHRYATYDELLAELQGALHAVMAAPTMRAARPVRHAPRRSRSSRKFLVLASAAAALALGLIAALIWLAVHLNGGGGVGGGLATPFVDRFDGPVLDASWGMVGPPSLFNHQGQITLVHNGAGGNTGLQRHLGRGSFQCVLRFVNVRWSPYLSNRIKTSIDDLNGNVLRVEIERTPRGKPVVRVIAQKGHATIATQEQALDADPAAAAFRIEWRESAGQWRIYFGVDGAEPTIEHPISPLTVGYPSSTKRIQRISISAEGGEGQFIAELDEYQLTR